MNRHPSSRKLFATTLIATQLAALPAYAVTRTLVVAPGGTFSTAAGASPWITINSGDTVDFVGLERGDTIVRIAPVNTGAAGVNICHAYDPNATNQDAYTYKRAFDGSPAAVNELTGPTRRGLSGLWALGPEGGKISLIETVNAECTTLNPPGPITVTVAGVSSTYTYAYEEETFKNGALPAMDGEEIDVATGAIRRLCTATTTRCRGGVCTLMSNGLQNFDAADPHAIPPGAYLNGLLDSTYANPDVTGVVIRVSWNDIQRDDGNRHIVFDFHNIDREFERAITHGKFVTLDIRAGRYGTPDWIFSDYVDPTSAHHASWCVPGACTLAAPVPAGAGAVEPLEFKDYYDQSATCGTRFRIGHPGDPAYRDAYQQMVTGLAAHVAADSRRFAALAHVKVSGLNLQTSEAELPHHCDDQYLASGFPVTDTVRDADYRPVDGNGDGDYTDAGDVAPDRIVDVWKKLAVGPALSTEACWCNPEIWYESPFGYTPDMVYDYYTELEATLVDATFGKKSLGYQIIQNGFPQADSAAGGFYGDHLYKELLIDATAPLAAGLDINACIAPDLLSMAASCPAATGLIEDPVAQTVAFCSEDTAAAIGLSALDHCAVQLEPTVDGVALAPYDEADPGGRYPEGVEQSEQVLKRGRNGAFGNPANPAFVNQSLGKLFVPQHSGLQPLPAEQLELAFQLVGSADVCEQQSTRTAAPLPLPPQFAPGAVGATMATFPMTSSDPAIGVVNQVSEITAAYNGCPNRWIVREGAIPVPNGPPMLTGFQNVNSVHDLDDVESSLMNLVYNTNGVFLELYEDVFWRASTLRGSGPGAAPLSTAGSRAPGGMCGYTDPATGNIDQRFCYSKRLSEWSEELHLRRWRAANLTNTALFPAFTDPFPTSYSFTFVNPTPGTPYDYFVIDPARCNPALAKATPALAANALVRIHLN